MLSREGARLPLIEPWFPVGEEHIHAFFFSDKGLLFDLFGAFFDAEEVFIEVEEVVCRELLEHESLEEEFLLLEDVLGDAGVVSVAGVFFTPAGGDLMALDEFCQRVAEEVSGVVEVASGLLGGLVECAGRSREGEAEGAFDADIDEVGEELSLFSGDGTEAELDHWVEGEVLL